MSRPLTMAATAALLALTPELGARGPCGKGLFCHKLSQDPPFDTFCDKPALWIATETGHGHV